VLSARQTDSQKVVWGRGRASRGRASTSYAGSAVAGGGAGNRGSARPSGFPHLRCQRSLAGAKRSLFSWDGCPFDVEAIYTENLTPPDAVRDRGGTASLRVPPAPRTSAPALELRHSRSMESSWVA
jgi:hypothetical protein